MAPRLSESKLQAAFGLALREERIRKELSQEELGFRSEVHRTYISELERGLKSPSLGTITRLSNALEVSPGALVTAAEALLAAKPRARKKP